MKFNRKILLNVLSQIKAYKDIVVFQDSLEEGYTDILYIPKAESPQAVHKMTICIGGKGASLFDDSPVETLGRAVPLYLSRIRGALLDDRSCALENGSINGIRVEVDTLDLNYPMLKFILNFYDDYANRAKAIHTIASVSFKKIEWAYVISECSKFISSDPTRYSMNGICFDFFEGGENFIHIVATDGRKLILVKHAYQHTPNIERKQFNIVPVGLFVPNSDYHSAQLFLTESCGRLLINTEDYLFEGLFSCIEEQFPNYLRVIPEVTETAQWFTLCPSSFRKMIDSVKALMGRSGSISLNASNPENLTVAITVSEESSVLDVDGMASRPMRINFLWEHVSPCLFDGLALTKFYLYGSNKAILSHSNKAGRGLSFDVTKIFMPMQIEGNDVDDFGIPLKEEQKKEEPSFTTEQKEEPDEDDNDNEDEEDA